LSCHTPSLGPPLASSAHICSARGENEGLITFAKILQYLYHSAEQHSEEQGHFARCLLQQVVYCMQCCYVTNNVFLEMTLLPCF
jgi:hypothetical protein